MFLHVCAYFYKTGKCIKCNDKLHLHTALTSYKGNDAQIMVIIATTNQVTLAQTFPHQGCHLAQGLEWILAKVMEWPTWWLDLHTYS